MLSRAYYNEQDVRKRQIDTLKIFNEHVTEVKENTEYRLDFVAGGKNMNLNVVLPPEFPNEKPAIFLSPVISHPWLAENSNQVVGAPGLVNYTPHSDLGRVVQAIIREFQMFISMVCPEEQVDSPPVNAQSLMFPELNELTVEELQEILENTDLQDRLLDAHPQLIEFDLETEELMRNIEEVAQENISKQQALDELKSDVIDRISTIVQMKINFEELNKKHQKLAELYDPHRIRDCLKQAALKADEEAENIAEQFLLGKIPVDAFVLGFSERRAQGQARRARAERLAHQLTQLDRAAV